jgi:hypothetical protein
MERPTSLAQLLSLACTNVISGAINLLTASKEMSKVVDAPHPPSYAVCCVVQLMMLSSKTTAHMASPTAFSAWNAARRVHLIPHMTWSLRSIQGTDVKTPKGTLHRPHTGPARTPGSANHTWHRLAVSCSISGDLPDGVHDDPVQVIDDRAADVKFESRTTAKLSKAVLCAGD